MRDYSKFPAPREVPLGRRVQLDQRRKTNNTALYGLLGLAGLCMCIGLVALVFWLPIFDGHPLIELNSGNGDAPVAAATSVRPASQPTERATSPATERASSKPTAVPMGRSGKDDIGLRVTVTTYQRPLPAQGIQIPAGQELALVTVRTENTRTSGTPLKVKPTDFYLLTSENEIFNPAIGGITTGSMFPTVDLESGKVAEGDLVFYIFSDVKDLSLVWKSADGVIRPYSLQRAR